MAEPTIVRYEDYIVDSCHENEWGDLIIVDQSGIERKINKKHNYLHAIFQPGTAVHCGIANFMDRDYIHTAIPMAAALEARELTPHGAFDYTEAPPEEPSSEQKSTPVDVQKVISQAERNIASPAPQEIGMWWKELGSRIGDGSIMRDFPNRAESIRSQYYQRMSEITQVKFK